MPESTNLAVHGPFEDVAIELVKLAQQIVADQPKEVKAELWKLFLEDWKSWRQFWKDAAK